MPLPISLPPLVLKNNTSGTKGPSEHDQKAQNKSTGGSGNSRISSKNTSTSTDDYPDKQDKQGDKQHQRGGTVTGILKKKKNGDGDEPLDLNDDLEDQEPFQADTETTLTADGDLMPSQTEKAGDEAAEATTEDARAKRKKVRKEKHGVYLLSEKIHQKIFSYLNPIDIHTSSQVCKLWREICDTVYNSPRVFNGNHKWGSSRSKTLCRLFLHQYILATENKRCFKFYLYNVVDWQMKTIMCEKMAEFFNGVKHMTKLHLVNCNFHWHTLITLLHSLPRLNTFTDTWSVHYKHTSCCSSFVRPYMGQGAIKKLTQRMVLKDVNCKFLRLRTFKLTRRSFTKELIPYLQIVARMFPLVEDFEFHVGPCETPKENARKKHELVREIGKVLRLALKTLRKPLKRLSILWLDEGLNSLFDIFVLALDKLEFPRLQEITIRMSDKSMRRPQGLPQFIQFLDGFYWKEDKNKFLHLVVHISSVFITKEWVDMLRSVQERVIRRSFHASLRFGVKLDDSFNCYSGQKGSSSRSVAITPLLANAVLGNYIFFRGLTSLQVDIKQEGTQSFPEVIPCIRATYPHVQKLDIRIGDRQPGKCFEFRDYSAWTIALNFKFITELRISDQPERMWDILDSFMGKTDRASLTYAYFSKRDIVLLCETLTRLRVLKIWANLNALSDINFTGIKTTCYYIGYDGQFFVNEAEVRKQKREPSLQNLKKLRLLSLRGLGKDVTDITCRYAFGDMPHLEFIELIGDTKITQAGRIQLHNRMRATGCKVRF